MIKRWVKATGTEIGPLMDLRAGYSPIGSATRLHAYSPHIASLTSDMPQTDQQVGYAFADRTVFNPPSDLEAFLSEGEAPIYVGFGSMPGINHERVNSAVLGALERTGLRAVVATGWGGIGELTSTAKLHVVKSVPHTWLFPRVAAVVHHGGSGTTHEGLRWGRPSIVCPLFADQPYFGQRVSQLGVGSQPIAQKHLTAEKLALALEHALSDTVVKNARNLGDIMINEDGANAITELVNQT
jgi:sterol 3beta-glucosyltransferase